MCNDGFIGIHQPTVYYLGKDYFFSSAFFFGVGFGDFGAGGQLPFLSFVTQLVSSFLAGSAAKVENENAKATNTSKCFILVPL